MRFLRVFALVVNCVPVTGALGDGGVLSSSQTTLKFSGGLVDENLVSVYKLLHSKAALPTKRIQLSAAKSLEDNLKDNQVLFSFYPEAFSVLLRDLNRDNPAVSLPRPIKRGVPLLWSDSTYLVVPDLSVTIKEEPQRIRLEKKELGEVAKNRNLFRYYNPATGEFNDLEERTDKTWKIKEWNPNVAPDASVGSISDTEIIFPADIVQATVPQTFVAWAGGKANLARTYKGHVFTIDAGVAEEGKWGKAFPPNISNERDSRKGEGLHWNVWAQSEEDDYIPVSPLIPSKSYHVTFQLAAFSYQDALFGKKSQGVSNKLRQHLESLVKQEKKLEMEAFVLVDSNYFYDPSGQHRQQTLIVDAVTLSNFIGKASSFTSRVDVMSDLREKVRQKLTPDYVLATLDIPLQLKDNVGIATVALMLFTKDMVPIDTVSMEFAVGPQGIKTAAIDGKGLQLGALNLASSNNLPKADATLYFLEFREGIFGLLKTELSAKDCEDQSYCAWQVNRSNSQTFSNYLRDTLLNDINSAKTDEALANRGSQVTNYLFRPTNSGEQNNARGKAALAALTNLVKNKTALGETNSEVAPTVIVYAVALSGEHPLVPANLVRIGDGDAESFLGRHAKVVQSMGALTHEPQRNCVDNWVAVLPPESDDEALRAAHERLGAVKKKWQDASAVKIDSSDGTMSCLQDWFEGKVNRSACKWDENGKKNPFPEPTVLAILSHYDHNSIWFEDKVHVNESLIQRRFHGASLAFLNGCGTAAHPSSAMFIRTLKTQGIQTVVATTNPIEGDMAGAYYVCLHNAIKDGQHGKNYTIAHAHFDALNKCLWTSPKMDKKGETRKKYDKDGKREDEKWGAHALKYVILGNQSLRVCLPPGIVE